MKIAILGGAGVRVPLLVHGLTQSDLPIRNIALYDDDPHRLDAIGRLAQLRTGTIPVERCATSVECVRDADFVFLSIRVGGIDSRARDESTAMSHGLIGQETVGPAGFAMAMRTIPHVVRYAQEVASVAPQAWLINFTNPVGIVTQAMRTETTAKVIGICDTPTELFEDVAHALDLPSSECHFDYFGLNHLGFLRQVYYRGEPQLDRLFRDDDALSRAYRLPLFPPEMLRELHLLPTEYVYYYLRTADAFENIRRAGSTRGTTVARLNEELFASLARADEDPVAVYERYLAARDATYMQIESGAQRGRAASPWSALTGYDKIALAVVRAIHFHRRDVLPLNVSNRGNVPELEDDDVVEVPCLVDANGALPMHVGRMPVVASDLTRRVKRYERLTVRAAVERSLDLAREALESNPLVPDANTAETLVRALRPLW